MRDGERHRNERLSVTESQVEKLGECAGLRPKTFMICFVRQENFTAFLLERL